MTDMTCLAGIDLWIALGSAFAAGAGALFVGLLFMGLSHEPLERGKRRE